MAKCDSHYASVSQGKPGSLSHIAFYPVGKAVEARLLKLTTVEGRLDGARNPDRIRIAGSAGLNRPAGETKKLSGSMSFLFVTKNPHLFL
jgi:hypothetical protein